MTTLDNPLSKEHLEKIIEGIEIADATIRAINRASKTGIDLANQLEEVRGQRKQLMALRNEYFPGL